MPRVIACVLLVAFVSSTGHAAQTLQSPRRILIVVDDLSLQFRSTPRVREQIRHTLQVLRRDGDLVGMTSTGESRVAVPLSANWNAADSSLMRVVGEALSPRTVASASATSEEGADLRRRAATAASAAATALRTASAAGSGPVTVLYFTEGYPPFASEPSEFVQEALRVNATIYVIDPRGVIDAATLFDAKDWESYLAATRGSVLTLASRTKGVAVLTRDEFDAVLSSLSKIAPPPQ